MDGESGTGSESRFSAYVEGLVGVIGHADRAAPLRAYCAGLLAPGERKSVEPMAAVTAPARVSAQHQSLLHFVGEASWSDERLLAKVRELVQPALERHGPIAAWIIDDTGLPKKGKHSVGVARQYCGQVGKQDNCQVAVSLSIANHGASLPVAYRLYLPAEWASDEARRRKARVPDDVGYQAKTGIALDQLRAACAAGIPQGVVLADPAYGNDTGFRAAITGLGLGYILGIQSSTTVWPPGMAPLPPRSAKRGRPGTRLRQDEDHRPISVKALAMALPADAWQTIAWREGTNETLASRFARVRVRPGHRTTANSALPAEEWLLIEWPEDAAEPTKYWLSTLAEDLAITDLVDQAKLRWRIERDYEELKQEVGLGHFEGRGWRGFHHHASLCIAAYGFLISERETIPPSGPGPARAVQVLGLSDGYRPRGAADPARTPRPELHRDRPTPPDHRSRQDPSEMPMLHHTHEIEPISAHLLIQ